MSTRGAGSNIYVRARVRRQKKRLFFLASLSWLAFPTSHSLALSPSLYFSFSFSIGPFHCLTPPWLASPPPTQLSILIGSPLILLPLILPIIIELPQNAVSSAIKIVRGVCEN